MDLLMTNLFWILWNSSLNKNKSKRHNVFYYLNLGICIHWLFNFPILCYWIIFLKLIQTNSLVDNMTVGIIFEKRRVSVKYDKVWTEMKFPSKTRETKLLSTNNLATVSIKVRRQQRKMILIISFWINEKILVTNE